MKLLKLGYLITLIVLLTSPLLSQEVAQQKGQFGFGVSLFNFTNVVLSDDIPSNQIYTTINIRPGFRIEPVLSFFRNENLNNVSVGLGVFSVTELEKYDIFWGLRGYNNNFFTVAPTLGGEYYLSRFFSISGEIQLAFVWEEQTIYTNTNVVCRFYFPSKKK